MHRDVSQAIYDEGSRTWCVRSDRGDVVRCKYFFMANGACAPFLGVHSPPVFQPLLPASLSQLETLRGVILGFQLG